MLLKILEVIRIAVGIGSIAGVFYLLSKFTKLDIWKRIAISVLAGLFIGAGFSGMTKTNTERQQEAAQEAERKQVQAQEQAKSEKEAKKSEKVAHKVKPLFSRQERAEAKAALQKFSDEGIIQKVEDYGDGLVRVWVESKFMMLPYDLKEGLCGWVAKAYFKDENGYIAFVNGYTGNDIGSFSARSGLKIKE